MRDKPGNDQKSGGEGQRKKIAIINTAIIRITKGRRQKKK